MVENFSMMSDQEQALIKASRKGDRAAFEELVRATYIDTYSLALRLTGNQEDARDVVQETYLRAWKGIKKFRGDAQFTTWLYRITANASYTLMGKKKRQRAQPLDNVPEAMDETFSAQPESMSEMSAGLAELGDALRELPLKLRMVVVLKDVYGMSHEDIAAELGISVAAAKVRLHRGRMQLRKILENAHEGDAADAV